MFPPAGCPPGRVAQALISRALAVQQVPRPFAYCVKGWEADTWFSFPRASIPKDKGSMFPPLQRTQEWGTLRLFTDEKGTTRLEEVVFIRRGIAYDRMVRASRPARDRR